MEEGRAVGGNNGNSKGCSISQCNQENKPVCPDDRSAVCREVGVT